MALSEVPTRRITSLLFLVALISASIFSYAQTITGSVRGTITDPTGAVIPNATVTATNVETGVKSSTKTNGDGLYSVRFLPIGSYTVSADANGFSSTSSSPFQLEINQEATINVKMQLTGANQQVVVNFNTAPVLNQENATLSTTFGEEALQSLPLNGNSFVATTVAIPGSIHTGGTANEQPAVGGNRQQANSMLLDGMDIYDNLNNSGAQAPTSGSQPQGALYIPNPNGLQEVSVITSNPPAEFGNVNGGLIVAVTKSGTNQLHGNANFQVENYNMNANTWANKDSATVAALTPYTQSFFGGSLGGPIKKDRLFFFVDYQGLRYHQSGTELTTVAPIPFRTGDLSGYGKPLYNSQNNGAAFVNNQIPINNPVAKYLFANPALYPLPNAANPNAYVQNNYLGLNDSFNRTNQGDAKIDWKLSRDTVSGRFSIARNNNGNVGTPVPANFPNGASSSKYTSFVLSDVHVFSSAVINELRAGFGRNVNTSGLPTDPSGQIGASGNSKVGIALPQNGYNGFTQQSFQNGLISSVGSYDTPQDFTENTFFYSDNLTIERGRHLMKMGGQFLRYQQNFSYSGNAGVLGQDVYNGSYSGAAFSDFLLNDVYQAQAQGFVGRFGQRQWRDGYFFQDDWKFLPNLTLNFGIRYDYFQPIYEQNNKEANVNLATGALEIAGQNGNSRALYNPTYHNIDPRFGFAYSPTAKFVLRGGYGISTYFEGMGVNLRLTQNPPFQQEFQTTASTPNQTGPSGNPSGGAPLTVGTPLSTDLAATGTYQAWHNIQPSATQQFNLTVEYQLSNTSALQVGYAGQVVRHIAVPVEANQWPASCANQATCPTAPFANSLGSNTIVKLTSTEGVLNYNGLLVSYHKNSHGFNVIANYTYSRAMTNGTQGYNGIYNTNGGYYQQNAFDLGAEYGPSPLDAAHNVSGSISYDLPFGRGQQFGRNINRVEDLALGGWRLGVLASAFTGNPLTMSSNTNFSVQSYQTRANHLRPLRISDRSVRQWFGTGPSAAPCVSGFNPNGTTIDNGLCAYSEESKVAFGSAANGSERGPGFQNVDLSGFKAFHITESQSLEFRTDAFNAFNFAAYSNPDTNVNDYNPLASANKFGLITSTRSQPRTLQLSLNYKF